MTEVHHGSASGSGACGGSNDVLDGTGAAGVVD